MISATYNPAFTVYNDRPPIFGASIHHSGGSHRAQPLLNVLGPAT